MQGGLSLTCLGTAADSGPSVGLSLESLQLGTSRQPQHKPGEEKRGISISRLRESVQMWHEHLVGKGVHNLGDSIMSRASLCVEDNLSITYHLFNHFD